MKGPIRGSYWIEPDRLLVGPYPGDDAELLAGAGIDAIVDLTHDEDGLAPYDTRIRRIRRPIRDFACPTSEEMRETLDLLDRELVRGSRVYLHCRGGIGRTGITTACYLIRRGATPAEALDRLAEIGKGPEQDEQRRFVLSWRD